MKIAEDTRKCFHYEQGRRYAAFCALPRLPKIHRNESVTKIRRNVSVTKVNEGMRKCFLSEDLKPLEVISYYIVQKHNNNNGIAAERSGSVGKALIWG